MNQINTFRKTLLLLIAIATFNISQAQLFETTIGDASNVENTWDGKPLPNGNYIMLSNTLSFSSNQQMMLTELDPAGNVVNVASLYDPANSTADFMAQALELNYDAAGNHIGYFITGQYWTGNANQMILVCTDLGGYMVWARMFNNVANGTAYDESGISIERQANGDVIVVGRSADLTTGDLLFCASRVDATGATVWARRYSSSAGADFIPKESCNGVRKSIIGNIDVVAITGRHEENGAVRTFVSEINATNGNEYFRKVYVSNGTQDQGLAIIQNPFNSRFMVVGESIDGAGNSDLWTATIHGNSGNLFFANTYDLGAAYSEFKGRDVCLNLNNNRAVIAGLLRETTATGTISRTFAMELPFNMTAMPVWFYSYPDSDPNPVGTESINPVQGVVGGAPGGYFITSDAFLTGAPDTDQHAIRVDGTGQHYIASCPEVPQTPARNAGGQFYGKAKYFTQANWNSFDLETAARDLTEEPCVPPFTNDNIGDRASDDDEDLLTLTNEEANIYPNPVKSGTALTIALNLEQAGTVEVTVFDLTGRRAYSSLKTLTSGNQKLAIPTNDFAAGAYFVRIATTKKHFNYKLYVQR